FGLYYFLVFGGFVALAQWLIPYYVSVYMMPLATAGLLAAIFSLPSGVIRALGGYLSDRYGARRVMYWVLSSCVVCCALLIVPRMDIHSPGKGIIAKRSGAVTSVSPDAIVVGEMTYAVKARNGEDNEEQNVLILPTLSTWQEPVVKAGDVVSKKQLLASGVTHIYFQANVWVFTALVFVVGIMMGIGKAAVYKHIPDYFPTEVGVVGGIVGVLGGLGGFFCPIVFGYMLEWTGLWITCWIFVSALSTVCLWWMHYIVQQMMNKEAVSHAQRIEHVTAATEPA
ncbi:MAG: MFS transporter, partial [Candidatus Hydrogenedentes bacterium]|nr:MFS transporter [Candidatus Hydrogenedentota bacterium]